MSTKKASQRHLLAVLRQLFPAADFVEDTRQAVLSAVGIDSSLDVDVFLPSCALAFEYDGLFHFNDVDAVGRSAQKATRDSERRLMCSRHGITLISIPYWWDGKLDSLANTIHQVRPDLVPAPRGDGVGIPESASVSASRGGHRLSPDST
jgi:hypothetical protein